jgi:hypothetical protein
MLPLLTAAVRYAINGRTVSTGAAEIRGLPTQLSFRAERPASACTSSEA